MSRATWRSPRLLMKQYEPSRRARGPCGSSDWTNSGASFSRARADPCDWLLISAPPRSIRGAGSERRTCSGVAYAAASGGTFLRRTAPKPRRLFYIDGEMPGSSLAQRRPRSWGTPRPRPIRRTSWSASDAQTEGMLDLATPEGQSEVDGAIDACDAELIVVDNLAALCAAGSPRTTRRAGSRRNLGAVRQKARASYPG